METNNKIRAALEQAKEIARTIYSTSETGSPHEDLAEKIVEIANAALAEPVRNYEVGTAEEQESRWKTNCGYGIPNCKHCKVYEEAKNSGLVNSRYLMRCDCRFIWAQMPYSGNDKAHAAVSIMGRESLNKQCWECANCKEPTAGWDGSKFRCAFLGKDFGTWHYDVPNECPCKGKGWIPKKKEGAS